jgi:hypothetical protein
MKYKYKAGDTVVAIRNAANQYHIGGKYRVKRFNDDHINTEVDDIGIKENGWSAINFVPVYIYYPTKLGKVLFGE